MKRYKKDWENASVVITDEQIKKCINEFLSKFYDKIKKKGSKSFNSTNEIYGKIAEEVHETLLELHARNQLAFEDELLDVAITALFGYMSSKSWPKKPIIENKDEIIRKF